MKVKYLVLGAGISGLSFVEGKKPNEYLVLEQKSRGGGYCSTTLTDDYVWDYAGHFFHFQNADLQNKFISKIGKEKFIHVQKNTKIYYKGNLIDYPFQKNIHELPKDEFIDCLYDLFQKKEKEQYSSFLDMLYGKFGFSIVEKFLKPYNEKLYACELNSLDVDAMGRFFPYADLKDIIKNMKESNQISYNDTFLYPKRGAMEFVNAIDVDKSRILFNIQIQSIDTNEKTVYTNKGKFQFDHLISTIPLNQLLSYIKVEYELSWNKVLVLNIGFDKKTNLEGIHWIYVPDKEINFYRLGFYDNILNSDKGSLYIEIGFSKEAEINIEKELHDSIDGLTKMNVISTQRIVEWQALVMDPAYVHIKDTANVDAIKKVLSKKEVYVLGRYGEWTYCSIEDCILSAIRLKEEIRQ